MASKEKQVEKSLNEAPEEKPKQEQKYTVAALEKNCIVLFGVTSSTFAGAMCGHDENEYTIDEVKRFIDVFLNGR